MGNLDLESKTSVKRLITAIFAVFFFASCGGNTDYSPKPRGYYRIVFPAKEYRPYTGTGPFTFQYPRYAVIDTDSISRKSARLLNMKSLLNMNFPQFKGTLHLSYESIPSKKIFNSLVEDAHSFAFKHTVKATSINQEFISYPKNNVYGLYYAIDGNAASPVQFFLTDSSKNYLRGALYFNTEPRLDSIQPVLTFVKKDLDVMIKSFRWKE